MSAYAVSARGLAGRKVPQGVLTPMGDLLFSASEPGAWYDPSDMSTLFQDSAGTVPVTAVEQPVGRILDKSGRGNHATQATTPKRPIYSRRVNLLTKTEQFSDATWFKAGYVGGLPPTVIENDAPGPASDGFADKVTFSAGAGAQSLLAASAAFSPSVYRGVLCLKAASPGDVGKIIGLRHASGGAYLLITLTADYQVIIRDETAPAAFVGSLDIVLRPDVGTSSGEVSMHLAYASLTLATDANLPYQLVNTATDYDGDPAKFPAYRRADGVDDSLASSTGGGSTTGFFFSAAISPQGSAGTARTLFSDAGTNTGYIVRLNTSNQLELSAGNGTAYTTVATSGTLAVGTTDVVQAWDDGTNLNVKIGSGATASIARPTVSAGTAGYTMGQDNGASTGYFNGRAYSTIYRKDSGLTQVQRESVALYQRQKMRLP